MSATYKLFARWTQIKQFRSAMAACEELGLSRASATNWKNGANAQANVIERMALDIGENPEAWVLAANAEKALGDEKRTLERLARKLGYAAMLCIAVYTSIPNAFAQSHSYLTKLDHSRHCACYWCGAK
ncbi:MAG: hypothetical protein ABIR62_03700 [Dokdonella sp.]|uniref:hypothetical protein n=1 Tax=Dokdonella sp. TaxID=2291710 RepID=UPI0032661DFF